MWQLSLPSRRLLAVGCQSTAGTTTGIVSTQQSGIWVSGEGKVSVTPDIATVQMGIQAQAETVAEAQAEASTAMDAVMASLQAEGVAEKDIQTQYFNISPVSRWDSDKGESTITGYQVTNIVTVKVREIDKAGDVIDSAVTAGGNNIVVNSINFSVDDPTAYYDTARTEAIAEALDKAQTLATLSGAKLGDPTYISESSSGGSIYRSYPSYDAVAAEGVSSTSISAGEIEVTLTVQIAYSIK